MTIAVDKINQDTLFGDNVIHSYSRAQAIEDGYLVDVTETAKEAGFIWPVALTRAAWEDCVEWCERDSKRQTNQDISGRLWDVVWMASFAIRSSKGGSCHLLYELFRVPRGGRKRKPRRTTLKMVTGPGENGEPVVTILLPNED
ncbi:MAG: hypothetical protein KZQ85_10825 [Candidatus Thiodiazotropha sp. (ex Myrtea sp. 'scaly one' KF741663)]|nr:hypothetical protein [Candidatus Thiodiazotropha sp. (ex Myrtea sp. 'scaly one' KF741663)]